MGLRTIQTVGHSYTICSVSTDLYISYSNALMSTLNARGGWTNLAGTSAGNVLFIENGPSSNDTRNVRTIYPISCGPCSKHSSSYSASTLIPNWCAISTYRKISNLLIT